MDADARRIIIARLSDAFGEVTDVTPEADQPLHAQFKELWLPEPWTPSPAEAISVWRNWPSERPEFSVQPEVVGAAGSPPESNSDTYVLGRLWRSFSYSFPWSGEDPVLVVQLWLNRFAMERN
jgi:hypothetical protein